MKRNFTFTPNNFFLVVLSVKQGTSCLWQNLNSQAVFWIFFIMPPIYRSQNTFGVVNAIQSLFWPKKFGPTQNILGPVEEEMHHFQEQRLNRCTFTIDSCAVLRDHSSITSSMRWVGGVSKWWCLMTRWVGLAKCWRDQKIYKKKLFLCAQKKRLECS